jgi:hypothetical protein
MSAGLADGLSAASAHLDTAVESLAAARGLFEDLSAGNWADWSAELAAGADDLKAQAGRAADVLARA